MTAKRGRGRVALPPGDKRRVKMSPHFTEGEAARLDAVRGDAERAEWLRVVAMREVGRREKRARRQPVAAVAAHEWLEAGTRYRRVYSYDPQDHAALVESSGWYAWHPQRGPRVGSVIAYGPETGPEGQRLADAALRAAGYVLADGGEA